MEAGGLISTASYYKPENKRDYEEDYRYKEDGCPGTRFDGICSCCDGTG